ncbi:hypothetical protein A4X03_0g7919 [Tilletia caries]|uniref:Transposase n=1 Tax=Tilletia caries TaxID=13290 RepID=A0A8T8SLT8_9BASI|nr:hypothetical protein A4X03_0g7919 [Tilletia caries]
MKRTRFTEEQIIGVLKEAEAGAKSADLARRHGVSEATIYNWKSKYGGLEVSEARRLKALEDENAKLKRLLADAMLEAAQGGPYRAERNSPYGPEDGVTHTLRLHAIPQGFANVMIEVRNDLVRDDAAVEAVSSYLADLISGALERVA